MTQRGGHERGASGRSRATPSSRGMKREPVAVQRCSCVSPFDCMNGAHYIGGVRHSILLAIVATTLSASTQAAPAQAALGAAVTATRQAIAAGDRDGAVRIADSLVTQFPDHPGLVILRAQTLAVAGRLDDAERDVRRLLAWDARYARRALQDSLLVALRPRLD